jgi:hypothetical protein
MTIWARRLKPGKTERKIGIMLNEGSSSPPRTRRLGISGSG